MSIPHKTRSKQRSCHQSSRFTLGYDTTRNNALWLQSNRRPARYKIDLTPAMQLKAKISLLKKVPSGFRISYGHTYTTPVPTTIATIPIGYADGYDRRFSSAGKVLIHGQYAPVVGRVCMDQLMVDVGHISYVSEEDEVVILGNQEGASITADDIATQLGTINYEVVSTIMHRVPRVYVT